MLLFVLDCNRRCRVKSVYYVFWVCLILSFISTERCYSREKALHYTFELNDLSLSFSSANFVFRFVLATPSLNDELLLEDSMMSMFSKDSPNISGIELSTGSTVGCLTASGLF